MNVPARVATGGLLRDASPVGSGLDRTWGCFSRMDRIRSSADPFFKVGLNTAYFLCRSQMCFTQPYRTGSTADKFRGGGWLHPRNQPLSCITRRL